MLWELELKVLDKSAMPLQAYRLRPTGGSGGGGGSGYDRQV